MKAGLLDLDTARGLLSFEDAAGVTRGLLQAAGNESEEQRFQQWARALPWFSEFKQQYGEEPNLNDPEYNYRAAWRGGVVPTRYAPDGGRYHWPSSLPDGTMLKSKTHPTAWMEQFMRTTGFDPAAAGIKSEVEGRAVMNNWKR
jgi:hypothetical protein